MIKLVYVKQNTIADYEMQQNISWTNHMKISKYYTQSGRSEISYNK